MVKQGAISLIILTAAFLMFATSPIARAEPQTVEHNAFDGVKYVDKIVGEATVPDIAHPLSVEYHLQVLSISSADYPLITLKATQHLTAQMVHVDLIERTTTWTAGSFNPWAVLGTALDADPLVWLMGVNPIHNVKQIAANERIRNTMRLESNPVRVVGQSPQSLDLPASGCAILIEAISTEAQIERSTIIRAQNDGTARISLKDLFAQLNIKPMMLVAPLLTQNGSQAGRGQRPLLTLRIGLAEGYSRPAIEVQIPTVTILASAGE